MRRIFLKFGVKLVEKVTFYRQWWPLYIHTLGQKPSAVFLRPLSPAKHYKHFLYVFPLRFIARWNSMLATTIQITHVCYSIFLYTLVTHFDRSLDDSLFSYNQVHIYSLLRMCNTKGNLSATCLCVPPLCIHFKTCFFFFFFFSQSHNSPSPFLYHIYFVIESCTCCAVKGSLSLPFSSLFILFSFSYGLQILRLKTNIAL